jgi:hypothetical protein
VEMTDIARASNMVNRLNLIQRKGRYYKEELVKKEMRKLLSQNPNGIGSEEFVADITDAACVSRGMVFSYIKDFEDSGLMRIERAKEDRRKAIYFPNIEKVETEQRFFEGMGFIRNLGADMIFGEGEAQQSGFRFKASVFVNQSFTKEDLTKEANMITENMGQALSSMIKMQDIKIPHSFKKAVIITLETAEGVKS